MLSDPSSLVPWSFCGNDCERHEVARVTLDWFCFISKVITHTHVAKIQTTKVYVEEESNPPFTPRVNTLSCHGVLGLFLCVQHTRIYIHTHNPWLFIKCVCVRTGNAIMEFRFVVIVLSSHRVWDMCVYTRRRMPWQACDSQVTALENHFSPSCSCCWPSYSRLPGSMSFGAQPLRILCVHFLSHHRSSGVSGNQTLVIRQARLPAPGPNCGLLLLFDLASHRSYSVCSEASLSTFSAASPRENTQMLLSLLTGVCVVVTFKLPSSIVLCHSRL